MPFIKLENFSGIVPRTGPTQLAPNEAQVANNVRVTSKELRSWKGRKKVFQCTAPGIRTVFKLYNDTTGAFRWLEWPVDVDVVKGPVADTTDFRIYYTGDGAPKKTNWTLATTSGAGSAPFPDAFLNLGVPAPAAAPTLAASQAITNVAVTAGGTGYTSAPTVAFSGGGGSGATATATISAKIDTISVTNGGTGYTSEPTVIFSGGGGSGATAVANIDVGTGDVTSIVINNPGSGYTSAPTITIAGGGGSGATATATISGVVNSVVLASGGSGYTSVPTVSFSGGGGSGATATASFSPVETRAYVYTNISTFGSVIEESAPSPAAVITCSVIGATVAVSGFSAAPTTNYNITHRRIYRTVVGANAVTYQLVEEIPVATTSYNDTKTVADLGSVLQTQAWNEPPTDLKGLVNMPNGMLAAFRNNEVWFAEPYYPHAWPDIYTLTVDSEIVGLGVYDTTLVVLTRNQPYLMTGTNPLSMSQTKLPIHQPCASKRSISSDQYGVLYASPNGLVSIGVGTQDVVTLPLYTREEWQTLNPAAMLATIYNNLYICFCQRGAQIGAIVIARADTPPLITFDFDANALFIDRSNGDIFGVSNNDNAIYQLDTDNVNRTFYEWLSKKFILPNPMNFAAFKVHADYGVITDTEAYNALVAEITANNQALFTSSGGTLEGSFNEVPLNTFTLNGSILTPIPPPATTSSANIFVYGDGQLIWSGGVSSPETVRLPAGFKAYVYEVRITGNIPVRAFAMSTSVTELREIMQ